MDDLNLLTILRIVKRRFWTALTLFSIALTATVGMAYFLPNIYRASAFILVEGQQIPKEYVNSTVTADIQNRLHTISQEILSRSRLEDLIREYKLYPKLRAQEPLQEVIAAMRSDIGISIKNVDKRRRQDEGSVAFEISYTGTDPAKVTLVTNRLASFYIEENLKLRERQALGTTDFLSDQLDQVKKQLEEQEQKIALFKRQHLGELPEQLDANLKTVERLQVQMQLNSDNLVRARERRDLLLKELDYYRRGISAEPGTDDGPLVIPPPKVNDLDKQVDELTRTLALLRARFSESHPDVIRTKYELAALEKEQEARTQEAAGGADPSRPAPEDPYASQIRTQIREIDAEIRFFTRDLRNTRKEIAVYQKRIEETPKREQELSSLTRDYDSTRELYASLLKRREESDLATSMEQRQKAERFRIIDPAIRPALPEGPNRLRILLMGLVLSLGAAAGGVFLRETLDDSFDSAEELQKVTPVPILVSIPRISTRSDRRRRRLKTALATCTLLISIASTAAGSYLIAQNNEKLVKRFTSGHEGQQLR